MKVLKDTIKLHLSDPREDPGSDPYFLGYSGEMIIEFESPEELEMLDRDDGEIWTIIEDCLPPVWLDSYRDECLIDYINVTQLDETTFSIKGTYCE